MVESKVRWMSGEEQEGRKKIKDEKHTLYLNSARGRTMIQVDFCRVATSSQGII